MTITGDLTVVAANLAEYLSILDRINNDASYSDIVSIQDTLTITLHFSETG